VAREAEAKERAQKEPEEAVAREAEAKEQLSQQVKVLQEQKATAEA